MSDQQRTQVYQQALSDAQSELDEMLDEFNALASRKDQLEHVMSVLAPLLHLVQAHPAQQSAPLPAGTAEPLPTRTFEPLVAHQPQQQFNTFAHDPTQDAPIEAAPAEVAHEKEPVAPTALAEASQPEQAVVLQQQETPAPQSQPANGDRLEERINFALNFALLS